MGKGPGPVAQRRRASDLYSLGLPVELTDGETELIPRLEGGQPVMEDGEIVYDEVPLPPVPVWIAKLSDVEMGEAFKHAARAQAVAEAAARAPESTDFKAMQESVAQMERDALVDILLDGDFPDLQAWEDAGVMPPQYMATEARVQGEPDLDPESQEEIPNRWTKDGHLEGLRMAWHSGLQAAYAADENDPEARRVFEEIKEFNDEVALAYGEARKEKRLEIEQHSDEYLVDQVIDLLVSIDGRSAWQDEYRLRVVFLCSRRCDGPDPDDPTHRKCLCRGSGRKHTDFEFTGMDEVRQTDGRIRGAIYAAWDALMVAPAEGKGLRVNRASSAKPESPATEEATETSGLTDANA